MGDSPVQRVSAAATAKRHDQQGAHMQHATQPVASANGMRKSLDAINAHGSKTPQS